MMGVTLPYAQFMGLIAGDNSELIPHEVVKISVQEDCSLIKAWWLHRQLIQAAMAEKLNTSQPAYQQLENSNARKQHATLENLLPHWAAK